MTPQEEHWRQVFLVAYKNNTGDARRLALNEAWFDFVSSDCYHNLALTNIQGFAHGHFSYWTALVDAAHVDQEHCGHIELRPLSPEEARALRLEQMDAKSNGIGGGGGAASSAQPVYVTDGQSITLRAASGGGVGGGTKLLVAKMQEFLAKEGETVDPYQEASLKKWIDYFGGTPKKDES